MGGAGPVITGPVIDEGATGKQGRSAGRGSIRAGSGRIWRNVVAVPAMLMAGIGFLMAGPMPAHAAMRGYIVTHFDSIRVEAPVHIILTTGSGVSGTGEGDRDMLNRVTLSVSGGALTVTMEEKSQSGFADGAVKAAPVLYLSTGQLRKAVVVGGAVLTIKELSGLEADIAMNGNGEIIVERTDVERLSLFVGGGGRVQVAGNARSVQASVNGPGALDAEGLNVHNAVVANDGPGTISLTVHGPARIRSSGSGGVTVKGKPVCTIEQSGVGQVDCAQ